MVRFITKNGKRIPISNNQRIESEGNDESDGIRIGNGTRVPSNEPFEVVKNTPTFTRKELIRMQREATGL